MPKRRGEMGGPVEREFGRLLRELRRERGWSQEQLAEISGCDRSYLSLLETGINSPSLSMVFQLARALEVSPGALLTRIEAGLAAAEAAVLGNAND